MLKSSSQQLGGKFKKLSELKEEYDRKKSALSNNFISEEQKKRFESRLQKLKIIIQKKKDRRKARSKALKKKKKSIVKPPVSNRSRNLSLRGGGKKKKQIGTRTKPKKQLTSTQRIAKLKRTNNSIIRRLGKIPSDNKTKKIERKEKFLKKLLEKNEKNLNILLQNNMNTTTSEKILDNLAESNTNVQVGGGKTRMDSIKNSLKTYKRRYNNAKTQESQERLNKIYNKILLNKTKLNIKYYKNKLNELQKNL